MKSLFIKTILILNNIIHFCYSSPSILKNNEKIQIYDYGIPSSIEEAYEWKFQKKLEIKTGYLEVVDSKSINGKMLKTVQTNKPFNFIDKTTDKDNNGYKIYKNILNEVAKTISNAFEIYETINIEFNVENFCQLNIIPKEDCKSILGFSHSPVYIPLRDSNDDENADIYTYPQALVKQLKTNKKISYSEVDFVIYLNSLKADADSAVTVLTHEILHGLGIIISGSILYPVGEKENQFLAPSISYKTRNENGTNEYIFLGFQPFSVFEKHLVLKKDPEKYYLRDEFKSFFEENEKLKENKVIDKNYGEMSKKAYGKKLNNKSFFQYSKEIAKNYVTYGSIAFRANDGNLVTVQTFDGRYEDGSSICHVSVPTKNINYTLEEMDSDFMMYYLLSNRSTNELVKHFNNKYGLIGPGVMRIMKTIGWTEKNTEKNNSTFIVANYTIPQIRMKYINNSFATTNVKISNSVLYIISTISIIITLFNLL